MRNRLTFGILMILVWIPTLSALELEWRYNEQYHYGYFVPFLTLLLCYQRSSSCPPGTSPPRWAQTGILLSLLPLIPLHWLLGANPDWRFLHWGLTLTSWSATLLSIVTLQGLPAARHYLPAITMILFSVPWISVVENHVTHLLMEWVTQFTVTSFNLSGIPALRSGNIIHLPGIAVGVEEACSGVRSLQSALMAGYLFGELLRLALSKRVALIGSAILLTFILNLARTLSLSLISYHGGTTAFEHWHDPIGNAVAISGFILIALIAKWMRLPDQATHPSPRQPATAWTSASLPALTLILPLMALTLNWIWYLPARTSAHAAHPLELNLPNLSHHLLEVPVEPIAKAQLKFHTGRQFTWKDEKQQTWAAFYFFWNANRISSHAGVHRPENCLPSAGLKTIEVYQPASLHIPAIGRRISFDRILFETPQAQLLVFHAVWNEGNAEQRIAQGWKDRFLDAWEQNRISGRHRLQILLQNPGPLEEATRQVQSLIDRMLQTETTAANLEQAVTSKSAHSQ
jgi:exosortase